MIAALKYCPTTIPYLVQHGQTIPENAWSVAIENNHHTLTLLTIDYPESIPQNAIELFVDTIENDFVIDEDYRALRSLVLLGYKPSNNTLYKLLQTRNFKCVVYAIFRNFPWNIQECFDYLDTLDIDDDYYLLVNKLLQNRLKYDNNRSVYEALLSSDAIGEMLKELSIP